MVIITFVNKIINVLNTVQHHVIECERGGREWHTNPSCQKKNVGISFNNYVYLGMLLWFEVFLSIHR